MCWITLWEAYLEWQQRLRRYEARGLSADAFCQQEDVPRTTFVDWLLILKQKRSNPMAVKTEARDESAERPAFVPVSVKASSYEIGLPNGSLVRLPTDSYAKLQQEHAAKLEVHEYVRPKYAWPNRTSSTTTTSRNRSRT